MIFEARHDMLPQEIGATPFVEGFSAGYPGSRASIS